MPGTLQADPGALVPAVLRGDGDALDRWYRLELPRVHRLAFGLLADDAEAQDLAQDALMHLLDRMADWDGRRSWSAWRTAVVCNLCRDRLRRTATRRRVEHEAPALPQRLPDPEDLAQRHELHTVLAQALRHLPEREREVFVLRDLEGASSAEAAAALGIQETTIRTLLSLARRRLRSLLGPHLALDEGGARG